MENKGLPKQVEGSDKLQSLKAFRRENDLCFKCGEKWNHNHKCPPHIPLHVLEELLDALEPTSVISAEDELVTQNEEVVLVVDTANPPPSRRTMRLLGHIGKSQLLILIDLGSVGTFVSTKLVNQLKLKTSSCDSAQYKELMVDCCSVTILSTIYISILKGNPSHLQQRFSTCNAMI